MPHQISLNIKNLRSPHPVNIVVTASKTLADVKSEYEKITGISEFEHYVLSLQTEDLNDKVIYANDDPRAHFFELIKQRGGDPEQLSSLNVLCHSSLSINAYRVGYKLLTTQQQEQVLALENRGESELCCPITLSLILNALKLNGHYYELSALKDSLLKEIEQMNIKLRQAVIANELSCHDLTKENMSSEFKPRDPMRNCLPEDLWNLEIKQMRLEYNPKDVTRPLGPMPLRSIHSSAKQPADPPRCIDLGQRKFHRDYQLPYISLVCENLYSQYNAQTEYDAKICAIRQRLN